MPALVPSGFYALLAAVLFGLGAPFLKRLVGEVPPVTLAGLLYVGAGVALLVGRLARKGAPRSEVRPKSRDLSRILLVSLLGGFLAPICLVEGVARLSATATSLLLNLEGPLTVLLAAVVLHEPMGRRSILAASLIFGGAAVIGFTPGALSGQLLGALLVALACAAWALDNMLSRKLADADVVSVVATKGLVAGPLALITARALNESWPEHLAPVIAALTIGALSYGVSLALYLRAVRDRGIARTSAIFSTAPFIGAVAAWPLSHEVPGIVTITAGLLMGAGVWLFVSEHHAHPHVHDPVDHTHVHVHDAHHAHVHRGDEGPEPHSHPHVHERLEHEHPHGLDVHHRHRHS